MNTIQLQILDCLFFGGVEQVGIRTSTRFPTPLTVYGCIGKNILNNSQIPFIGGFHPILGKYCNDLLVENCHLTVFGPLLAYRKELYFPSPANLYKYGKARKLLSVESAQDLDTDPDIPLGVESAQDIHTDLDIPLMEYPGDSFKPSSCWISSSNINKILRGELPERWNTANCSSVDQRYSHALDYKNRNVQDNMFYSKYVNNLIKNRRYSSITEKYHLAAFTNFNIDLKKFEENCTGWNIEQGVEKITVSRNNFPEKLHFNIENNRLKIDLNRYCHGLNALGGEGYQVNVGVDEYKYPSIARVSSQVLKEKQKFIMYFPTPIIFKKGWRPAEWKFLQTLGKNAILKGVALKKPEPISGYQVENYRKSMKGRERKVYQQIPSGSVYFFKTEKWQKEDFQRLMNEIHTCQSQSEVYPAAGFGVPLIGLWPKKRKKF